MGTTANKGLYLLSENQQGAEVTFNESMYKMDALMHCAVEDVQANSASATATHGKVYLVADSLVSNDFVGMENHIAYYVTNQWKFVPPKEGMRVWVKDDDKYMYYTGSAWSDLYGREDSLSGHIVSPIAQDYCLVLVAAEAMTITKLSALTGSGTCTIGLSVADAAVGNTRSVTTSIAHLTDFDSGTGGDQTLAVAAGQKLDLVVSSPSGALDLQFVIAITRSSY
jgi:hypothetical protein